MWKYSMENKMNIWIPSFDYFTCNMSNAQNIDLDSSNEEISNQDFNFDIYIYPNISLIRYPDQSQMQNMGHLETHTKAYDSQFNKF